MLPRRKIPATLPSVGCTRSLLLLRRKEAGDSCLPFPFPLEGTGEIDSLNDNDMISSVS